MFRAAASFDLRQHFVDDSILSKRLPEGRIQVCSRSATVSYHRVSEAGTLPADQRDKGSSYFALASS